MFNAAEFASPDLIPFLLELGKREWLKIGSDGETMMKVEPIQPQIVEAYKSLTLDKHKTMAEALMAMILSQHEDAKSVAILSSIQILAKMFATGPKVFKPTYAQCLAMENVRVTLTPKDYQQSYPVMITEFPAAYVHERELPTAWIAIYKDQEHVGATLPFSRIYCGVGVFWNDNEMEHGLIKESLKPFALMERVALNCNMLLSGFQTRLEDHQPRRWLHDPNPERRRQARIARAAEGREIKFVQEIEFHTEQGQRDGRNNNGDGGGWQNRGHWRRGHWRNQRIVPMPSGKTKYIFIRPVFIHSELFAAGEIPPISVIYKPKPGVPDGL